MSNINLKSRKGDEELLELCKNDMIAFGKAFLPDDFMRSETPFFHYEIADTMFEREESGIYKNRNLAIILPRGHGKTVLTKCDILHSFCFAKEPLFYGWVSATQKLSTGNMDYIKTHLEFNEKIRFYFGDLKGRKWTESDIELNNGCKLISKSNISGIRGGAKLHKRYDLIILDDFEDENNTLTPESRAKNSNMVTAVVHPALEPLDGRLRINGTPVHYDSFINNLIINYNRAKSEKKDFSWQVITYKALQDNGTTLWPSWFPPAKLEEKKKFYQDSGQPYKFYQEYMMEVQSEEDSIFNMRHINYHNFQYRYDKDQGISYLNQDGKEVPVSIWAGVDPATDSDRRDSDFSVLLVVACCPDNNVYVLEYVRKRNLTVVAIPGENQKGIVDYIFELNGRYHPKLFVIEETTMSRPVFQSLMTEMRRKNDFTVKFRPEKPGNRMSKKDRIQEVLAQRMAIGSVKIKESMYDLQHEILQFGPRMGHDDTIDALAYAVKYAHPPHGLTENEGTYVKRKYKPKNWVIA